MLGAKDSRGRKECASSVGITAVISARDYVRDNSSSLKTEV